MGCAGLGAASENEEEVGRGREFRPATSLDPAQHGLTHLGEDLLGKGLLELRRKDGRKRDVSFPFRHPSPSVGLASAWLSHRRTDLVHDGLSSGLLDSSKDGVGESVLVTVRARNKEEIGISFVLERVQEARTEKRRLLTPRSSRQRLLACLRVDGSSRKREEERRKGGKGREGREMSAKVVELDDPFPLPVLLSPAFTHHQL